VSQQLALLSDALLKARVSASRKESLMTLASTRSVDSLPAVLQSAAIAGRKQELATLESEYRKLNADLQGRLPAHAAARGKDGRDNGSRCASRSTGWWPRSRPTTRRRWRTSVSSRFALTQQRKLARGLSDSMAEYSLLRREVDTNRELFASLLGRLRETQISAALFTSNISVVDRAEVPSAP